jgi:Lysyl oxidase
MGTSGRRIGLSLVVLLVVAGTAATVAMAAGDPAAFPRGSNPSSSPSVTAEPTGPQPLLPNLRSLSAADLQVERTSGGRLLRFSASLANLGPGPLLLRPRLAGEGCPRGQHPAAQVLHRDTNEDGAYQPRRDLPAQARRVGCMLDHPTHDHWHFDGMAGYSLTSPTTGETVAAQRKVSFCLRDNRRVPRVDTNVRREHFGECNRGGPQGISPGWVDVYVADLPGQFLPLPRGSARRVFCLDLTADPIGRLVETDETDNGTSITVVVAGNRARRGPAARCEAGGARRDPLPRGSRSPPRPACPWARSRRPTSSPSRRPA